VSTLISIRRKGVFLSMESINYAPMITINDVICTNYEFSFLISTCNVINANSKGVLYFHCDVISQYSDVDNVRSLFMTHGLSVFYYRVHQRNANALRIDKILRNHNSRK